jgi:ATP synthase F1 gamma subunit
MRLLSAIKKDMDFNQNLYNLVEALKEISIAQYRILEKKLETYDHIFSSLGEIYGLLQSNNVAHPILQPGDRQAGVIALTSDAGLLGGLNMGVMSQVIKEAQKTRAMLIIIGERGQLYAQESGLPFVTFKGVKDETRLEQAQQLRDYVLQEELAGRLGELKIVYPFSLSIVSQQVKVLQLLPFAKSDAEILVRSPGVGAESIIVESEIGSLLEYWMHLYLGQKFHQIFGLSRLAELSARFTHLETSKGKIDQLNKDLRLQYFRQRHEMIDRNMRELFSARMAMKS